MKFVIKAIAFLSVALLTGCASPARSNAGMLVYTSFAVPHALAKAVCGEHAEIRLLIPPGVEPHHWEPSPKDMVGLASADLIVINGNGMESWSAKVRASLPQVPFCTLSEGLSVLEAEEAAHEHEDHDDHEHNDSHSHEHDGTDPHMWLYPLYAAAMADNLRDELIKADPAHEADYRANAAAFRAKAEALDATYTSALAGAESRSIIVSHAAYAYLCAAYGLTQVPVEGLSADGEPSMPQLVGIIDFIQGNNITHIFYASVSPSKTLEMLAKDTGTALLPLSPLEIIPAGADYFSVMEQNLESLKEALIK